MRAVDIIEKKKDGRQLTTKETEFMVNGYTSGAIPDYQMSAFCMAIYFQGLSDEEIYDLTNTMVRSGDILNMDGIDGITVDKHSTGGVGDKTTLIVGPMAASFGVPIAKMSGRGLGHTGGTIDKLESIPGFTVELTNDAFIRQVNDIHMAVIGQTADLVPADKLLYSLRDVTATVDSKALIASSIMSKKIAAGAEGIVLDVKTGEGAFMQKVEDARELARLMVRIGFKAGRNMVALLTNMEQPLGNAVGNVHEIMEVIECLKGNGPADLMEVCNALFYCMIYVGGITNNKDDAYRMAHQCIEDGSALETFRKFITAQGGADVIAHPELLEVASKKEQLLAWENGYISRLDAREVGNCEVVLGGGRLTKTDAIDRSVGVYIHKKVGDQVQKGDVLMDVYGNVDSRLMEAKSRLLHAYKISQKPVEKPSMVQDIILTNNYPVCDDTASPVDYLFK